MKKYLAFLAVAGVFVACSCGGGSGTSGGNDTAKKAETPAATSGDITTNPVYQKGIALVGSNDCLTCHDMTSKKIGPAYNEVAKKYAGVDTAVNYLAHKIIAGGSGVWGATPMTPHASLPVDSAKAMVEFILLLKDQQ